jgi:16S rRNA (cytidine1402-2'-O)-methyltransferase
MDAVKNKPTLLLLPNLLGDVRHHEIFLPPSVDKAVASLDGLIAESVQAGRRYLSRFETSKPAHDIPIALYNEHTPDKDIDFLLEPIKSGQRWGVVSDCGLPCVADPGSRLVARARLLGINIQAFVGPSSILLALMQSGLPGQKFYFHGYLNKESAERRKEIQKLQKASAIEEVTQIFIETPYRNQQMLESLLETLNDDVSLCVAWDLTSPQQGLLSQPVAVWKKSPLPNLSKKCAIFLFASADSSKGAKG